MNDDVLLQRIETDMEAAGLEPRQLAMLRYAEKLTRTPADMVKRDVEALRVVGFSDTDVLQICETIAYYAYVNRIADGLGVEVEVERENVV